MISINSYLLANKPKILKDLCQFLSIPSVSTQSEHKQDMFHCAHWLTRYLKSIGLSKTRIYQTKGHPVIYGEWQSQENKKTLIIYGHYDVQPAEPLEKWKTPPFSPKVKNEKIFARGADDNKGQLFANIWAIKYYLENYKKLPVNIKLLIEGEEESGGKNLEPFIKKHKDLLCADLGLISDSSMLSKKQTSLTYGVRGIVYFEIEVTGPKQDIHSGTYGGIVQNPTNALAQIISRTQNENGDLLIPGIYRNVRILAKEEKDMIGNQIKKDQLKRETGVSELIGDRNLGVEEIVGGKPSLDVHGIWGGFRKQGEKTIIPDMVTCKLSIRTVPNMTVKETAALFTEYIQNIKPRGVKVNVKVISSCETYLLDYHHPLLETAGDAIYKGFGIFPKFSLEGGSIPAPTLFKKYLNLETILMGYGLPDDNLHGPNEKMDLSQIWKGIKTTVSFFNLIK